MLFKPTHELAIQEDERVLLWIHKHWYILFRDSLGVLTALITPLILFAFLSGAGVIGSVIPTSIATLALSFWLLGVWVVMVTVWTNYYLDVWIVTDKRIINIEQIRLFYRDVTTLRFERLQDATVKYHGFISEMLDFGTLKIQTAGFDTHEMEFEGIPKPDEVKRIIFEQVDRYSEVHQQAHDPRSAEHASHDE